MCILAGNEIRSVNVEVPKRCKDEKKTEKKQMKKMREREREREKKFTKLLCPSAISCVCVCECISVSVWMCQFCEQ